MAQAARWSDKKLKALALPAGKTEQRVLVEPGLYLYMRQRAGGDIAKQWQHRSQVDGVRRWVSLGAFPAVGLATARAGSLPHRSPREAAQKPRGPHAGRAAHKTGKSAPTVAATFGEWIADKRRGGSRKQGQPAREKPLQALTDHFDHAVRARLGDIRIDALTTEALQACVEGSLEREDAPSAAQVYRTLRGLVTFAKSRGYITGASPLRGVQKPKHTPRAATTANVADDAEILTLLNAVDDSRLWPATKMAIELPLFTGARPTEVRLATWSEFDLANQRWTIPAGRVKSGREFGVHLSPQAVAVLERARAHQERTRADEPVTSSDFVFKGAKGQAMEKMAVARALARLAKRTEADGGKKLAPRDLRGSFRGLLGRVGTRPETAEWCMNHPPAESGQPMPEGDPELAAEMAAAWDKVGAYIAALRTGLVPVGPKPAASPA